MKLIRRLAARWYLVPIAAAIAVLVGGSMIVHLAHGGLKEKRKEFAVGSAELLVDSDPSTLIDVSPASGQTDLASRAPLIATYSNQPSVRDAIARRVGVSPSKITLESAGASKNSSASNSPGRDAIEGSGKDSVVLHAGGNSPTIDISTQAKKPATARALANATIVALQNSLGRLSASEPVTTATSSTTTSTTSTTTSTATGTATGKKGAGKSSVAAKIAAAKQAAAKRSDAKLAAAKRAAARRASQSKQVRKIVLRRLGAIDAATVVDQPRKLKAAEVAIVVFIALVVVILLLDGVLISRTEERAVAVQSPSASAFSEADDAELPASPEVLEEDPRTAAIPVEQPSTSAE